MNDRDPPQPVQPSTPDTPIPGALTPREVEVLQMMGRGQSNETIAAELFISLGTARWYTKQIYGKLGVHGRAEAIVRAAELGLLNGPLAQVNQSDGQAIISRLKHNLPAQTTPFIGRETELDALYTLLTSPDIRLLTILAPGGMGKTRLALETAEQQLDHFQHGVYFVPLQPIHEAHNIISQIATSTGYQFTSDKREPRQQVLDFLSNKQMLLLLDNFEHLLDGGVSLLTDILQAAPNVRLLVTSREKLNLSMETVYTLSGMEFPAWKSSQDVLQYDSAQLLLSAARRVKPEWEITSDNLDDVARLCRLTQGMPLAILLAAGWLDVLTLADICDEIQRSADFLETEMRDVPERQRSIQAVFETTWVRLNDNERSAFMRMSVFRGGCTAVAAQAVTGVGLRVLQLLVNKALLMRNREGRYDIHELLRQYAEAELEASGEADAVRDAHLNYYADAMQERESHLKDHRQLEALNDIEGDFENVRAAWEWGVKQRQYETIGHMALATHQFIQMRNRYKEGVGLFSQAARQILPTPDKLSSIHTIRILMSYANLLPYLDPGDLVETILRDCLESLRQTAYTDEIVTCLHFLSQELSRQSRFAEALSLAQKCLSLVTESGDRWFMANSLMQNGFVCGRLSRSSEAHAYLFQGLALFSETGDKSSMAFAQLHIGYVMHGFDKPEVSFQHSYQAYQLFKEMGNKEGTAGALNNLGAVDYTGDWDRLEQYNREALALRREIGNRVGIAYSLINTANILIYKGQFKEAEALINEGLVIAREINDAAALAISMVILSQITDINGEHEKAYWLAWEADEYAQTSGSGNWVIILHNKIMLGWTLCCMAKYEDAINYLLAALGKAQETGHMPLLLESVAAFTLILTHQGQYERAAEVLGLVFYHPVQMKSLTEHPRLLELCDQLHTELGNEAFSAAWERGKSLDLDMVAKELLAESAGEK